LDAAGTRGFLLQVGVFTPIDFPLAAHTIPMGINDAGEIAGYYFDATGYARGFIYANGAFSSVAVAGARATVLTSVTNGGLVAGIYVDALDEEHGFTGQ
jgi:hypothetical protein